MDVFYTTAEQVYDAIVYDISALRRTLTKKGLKRRANRSPLLRGRSISYIYIIYIYYIYIIYTSLNNFLCAGILKLMHMMPFVHPEYSYQFFGRVCYFYANMIMIMINIAIASGRQSLVQGHQ